MRKFLTLLIAFSAFFFVDFLLERKPPPIKSKMEIPFAHKLHGENIGLECGFCHKGASTSSRAKMPSPNDCLDCHRLPLTENDILDTLDSLLHVVPDSFWERQSQFPSHVVFHHGVHFSAGVSCEDCHQRGREKAFKDDVYGGENFNMKFCLSCHRGELFPEKNFKPAATDCSACHR